MANSWDITTDGELETAVRHETGYEVSDMDDLRLSSAIDRAKQRLYLETGSQDWYSDSGLGLALFGYACMRAKSSIENIPLDSYSLGDEDVSFDVDDPEDSLQLQQWAEDVRTGLTSSDATSSTSRGAQNTADYVGSTHIEGDGDEFY